MLLQYLMTHYNYYDAPDGHHPFEKVYGCAKWGFTTGLVLGTADCLLYSDPKTWKGTFNCLGFWIVPLSAMGASFAAVTYVATNVRGKDDKWNYVLGALSSTGILHSWRKSMPLTCCAGVAMVAAAILKKDSIQNGWQFFPTQRERIECYECFDFSLTKEPTKKGWIKA